MLASASVLALEPKVGGVYARLIVGGAFVLLAGGTLLMLHLARAERRNGAALSAALSTRAGGDEALRRQTQFAQIAMMVEAVMIEY
ncbi:MAG: hypothetical protein FJX62_13330 [Alphaproteobacteria bacterium]|nr:hypothetical protein [Alphaproteobacteria bacterium]